MSGSTNDVPINAAAPLLPAVPKPNRLHCLDIARGLTIATMILVDEAGVAWPSIDHSPWDGVTLADTVMPSFDFILGVSIALAFKRVRSDRPAALRRVAWRSFKLFVLGLVTQGGVAFMDYDLQHIRIMGILQRIAFAFGVAGVAEVALLPAAPFGTEQRWSAIARRDLPIFALAALLVALHTALIYGIDVPDNDLGVNATRIACGRGLVSPPCNAAAYVDRAILGVDHMYFPTNGGNDAIGGGRDITYQRMPQCSTCAPGRRASPTRPEQPMEAIRAPLPRRCQLPDDAPAWCCPAETKCDAYFDPEGVVSTLSAVVAPLAGLHFGARGPCSPSIPGVAPLTPPPLSQATCTCTRRRRWCRARGSLSRRRSWRSASRCTTAAPCPPTRTSTPSPSCSSPRASPAACCLRSARSPRTPRRGPRWRRS